MEEIAIQSEGARMNGFLYLAAGAGPHPVVIFLHGYPGNERNLDLAQAVRRAGYQALYVDYRGAWGSGGTFSFAHGLEDVAAVLAWVREPGNAAKYRLDVQHIALVGHSYGGWLALLSAAREAPGVCVAALAAFNVGWAAKRFEAHPTERSDNLNYFRMTTDPAGGPIHADADELLEEMTAHATAWDYVVQAKPLKDHVLLLIAATRDTPDAGVERQADLARAIRGAGGRRVRTVTYEDDHLFSSHRIEVGQTLTQWLRYDCGFEAPRPRQGRTRNAARM
jgi:pimeloyl-ACP methyl ester carboxylesterase